ncbi:MAG TPA: ubiquinol-cytochrome c reductase iron-sulfur subunit [Chloroflexota bacterium]|nr:ubiquinol-cytochrome c reductase iron-sulfur subunit [Chloroflexota bacterium]
MARQAPEQGLFYPGAEAAAEAERRSASPNPGADVPIEIRRGFWSRRTLLRFAGWGTLLALVGQWLTGFGVFFWPKKVGAFGGEILGGAVDELKVGDVKMLQAGKCYLSRVPEGVLALWWKCPHLGCTVPWKPEDPTMDDLASKGRFNCPCHGSLYDRYGNIIAGPAPRPMYLFKTSIRDGKIYIDTNPTEAEQRARAGDQVKSDPTPI